MGVGRDQRAVDAELQRGGVHQAEHGGHIAQQKAQPGGLGVVKQGIHQQQADRKHRLPDPFAAVWDTAFLPDPRQREQGAEQQPARHQHIAGAVAVVRVGPQRRALGKGEHQLVQVVGQHQHHQKGGKSGKPRRPPGQGLILRFPQRHGHQHAQHGDKQHGQVIQIPEVAGQVGREKLR